MVTKEQVDDVQRVIESLRHRSMAIAKASRELEKEMHDLFMDVVSW